MSWRRRVLSGAVMLMVVCGWLVAPAFCQAACPSGVVSASTHPQPTVVGHTPCHEVTAGSGAVDPGLRLVIAATPDHQCDHASVVAAPRLADVRLSAARVATIVAAGWAWSPAIGRIVLAARSAGGPAPPTVVTFSPVLRI